MDRRTFLSWVGVGFLASSLPIAIAACTAESDNAPSTSSDAPPPAREDGFISLGSVEELESSGLLKSQDAALASVLVVKANDQIQALDTTCTHQGCTAEWDSAEKVLACPCHGSKFNPDGTVANGPAEAPLKTFEVKTEDNLVLVKPA
ncbi:QcrA and Rieske domain-containing protein [Lyngbya confervoides]|uniref:Rieske (2Fe-2S) protein n=1 Tax=Lyngbya confervoides BDU141951 TaxID=1574623 RepID=A0ABD4T2Z4_9CYAN|nr:Rieske (2Fe-2S) protein [Lyngbya confervoides]MCM1982985.1 Rieske (2Fe-2S) protein [Lyngbya confervoides BDU141951]